MTGTDKDTLPPSYDIIKSTCPHASAYAHSQFCSPCDCSFAQFLNDYLLRMIRRVHPSTALKMRAKAAAMAPDVLGWVDGGWVEDVTGRGTSGLRMGKWQPGSSELPSHEGQRMYAHLSAPPLLVWLSGCTAATQ
jgi:hypothetical protein